MSTKFLSPGWRMPRNANQSRSSNYSLDFDGSDYINAGRILGSENTSTVSVSFWLKIPSTGAKSYLGYFIGNFGAGWLIEANSSSMYFAVGDTTTSYQAFTLPYSGNIAINTWYHIVMVYDGNQTGSANILKVYINGTQKTLSGSPSFPSSIPTLSGAEFTIGGIKPTSVNGVKSISSVSIFDYALSASQVTTLYGTGSAIGNPMALPRTPIAYYPLGGSAGAFRTPVNVNDQWLIENNAIGDYVFDFNGGSNVVDAGTGLTITRDLTLSGWVKFTSTSSGGSTVISKHITANSQPYYTYRLYIESNKAKFRVGISTATFITGSTDINDGNWHHILGTYDGSNVKLYVDGISDAAAVSVSGDLNTNVRKTTIGGVINGDTSTLISNTVFNGELSNTQIFNTALSGPEVETLYNYGSPIQTLANIPQSSNLKAWYKLDATEIYNSSSTEWSIDNNQNPSAYQSSLDFSGTNQYISCSSSSVFQNTSNFSVSFWVNMDDYSGGGCILMAQNAGSDIFHLYAYGGNTIQVRLRKNGSGNGLISNIDLNNKWNNICLVYDGTKTGNSNMLKFYLNKVEQTISFNSDIQSSINIGNDFLIGQQSGQSGIYTIDGKLSNVCLFSNSLTDGTGGTLDQIETLYNSGTPLADMSSFSSLVSWWKLDNTTTGIEDSKGSNNGTNNGATEYPGFVNTLAGESSGMSQTNLVQSDLQTVAPYSKYAMSFDGNGYIDCGSVGNFTSSFTASCWINNWPSSGQKGVLGNTNGQSRGWLLLAPHATNSNAFKVYIDTTNGWHTAENSNGFSDNTKWVNLVVVYDSINNTLMLYSNTVEGVTATQPTGTLTTGADPLRIGSEAGYNNFNGNISNAAIWNTALSASEVREIYNEGRPSNLHNFSGAAPVAWWQLGENSSFNGNDWIVADEIGSNNGDSNGMGVDALTNGVGTTANGVSSGMSEGSLVGDAPYSTGSAISSGMAFTARGTDVPS